MRKDLYLVRHGQTLFNLKRIIQGWSDSPLTDLGCEQARRAGEYLRLRGVAPTEAYASTLTRTNQTIACVWPGLAFGRLDDLREWYFGEFEAERISLMPQRPWRNFFCQFGGESQDEVRARMVHGLDAVMASSEGCVLAVSHGSAIKEFMDAWAGPAADARERVPRNCATLHFVWSDEPGGPCALACDGSEIETAGSMALLETYTQATYAEALGLEEL